MQASHFMALALADLHGLSFGLVLEGSGLGLALGLGLESCIDNL